MAKPLTLWPPTGFLVIPEWCRRYCTEEEAIEGHTEIVAVIAATVPNDRIERLASWPAT